MSNTPTPHDASQSSAANPQAFYNRLSQNAFRRLPLFLIPILLIGLVGVRLATRDNPDYKASGVLSASSNQLVDNQFVQTESQVQTWESPAAGTARLINERLTTNSFIKGVAANADLAEALESGLIAPSDLRANVWASADGNSLLSINATWSDPETAFNLVNGTIESYSSYIADSVAAQSDAAVKFYEEQKAEAQAELDVAEAEFNEYVDTLAPANDNDRPLEETTQITRLDRAVDAASERVRSAEDSIDNAKLVVQQSWSEAGRTFQVVDSPTIPSVPESTLFKKAVTVFVFLMIGTIIAGIALFLTTLLDRSVRSVADLEVGNDPGNIAVVPRLTQRKPRSRPSRPGGASGSPTPGSVPS